MLILTRRIGERILIGDDTWITITGVQGGQVKIGFDVPQGVKVLREELIGTPAKAAAPVRVSGRLAAGHGPMIGHPSTHKGT